MTTAEITIQQAPWLEKFQCLGSACEDTCCRGWGMQITAETLQKYEKDAPELLEVVTTDTATNVMIMKRDAGTDYCVKYSEGWCGVHQQYGTDFLGDACHFYPRSTRQLGQHVVMNASLSCPEVVRLALYDEKADASYSIQPVTRLPFSLKKLRPLRDARR
jgi:lysine-N-methylase